MSKLKFVEVSGFSDVDDSSVFRFEKHNPRYGCIGDQIWSNGEIVHIFDYVSTDVIYEFSSMVENKKAFLGACRCLGLI